MVPSMSVTRILAVAACVLGLTVPGWVAGQDRYDPGREVLAAMHDRHHATWHETLTFVQRSIIHRVNGSVDTAIWYEAEAPGRLRIDIAPTEAGNGAIFRDGMRYRFQGGELTDTRPNINALLLVLADLYHFPVDRTAGILDSLGFDLSVVSRAEWRKREVTIVGAAAGDTTASQVWVDTHRLLPVRLIQRADPQGRTLVDAHIGGWAQHDGSWVESDIRIHVNGQLRQVEEYTQIRVNVPLPESLWDPARWTIDEPYWR